MREDSKNDFFDFDMDTNIMDKLESDKNDINSSKPEQKLLNKKRKSNSINLDSTWSYNNILSEEKKC